LRDVPNLTRQRLPWEGNNAYEVRLIDNHKAECWETTLAESESSLKAYGVRIYEELPLNRGFSIGIPPR
jgi:hypothetical protein